MWEHFVRLVVCESMLLLKKKKIELTGFKEWQKVWRVSKKVETVSVTEQKTFAVKKSGSKSDPEIERA